MALSQWPDVAESYAAMQASKADVEATRANYFPKVYVGATSLRTREISMFPDCPRSASRAQAPACFSW